MRQVKWVLFLCTIFGVALAADSTRPFADAIVDMITRQDDAALYETFSPLLTANLSREQAASASRSVRAAYGQIKTAQYWRTTSGVKVTSEGRLPMTVIWYKVTTDRFGEGLALRIELTTLQGQESMIGYYFMQNIGKPPSPSPKNGGA
jgi:hypothetical protein